MCSVCGVLAEAEETLENAVSSTTKRKKLASYR